MEIMHEEAMKMIKIFQVIFRATYPDNLPKTSNLGGKHI